MFLESPWEKHPELAISKYKRTQVSHSGAAAFDFAKCVDTRASDKELIRADKASALLMLSKSV